MRYSHGLIGSGYRIQNFACPPWNNEHSPTIPKRFVLRLFLEICHSENYRLKTSLFQWGQSVHCQIFFTSSHLQITKGCQLVSDSTECSYFSLIALQYFEKSNAVESETNWHPFVICKWDELKKTRDSQFH